ncbi:MAG: helix-turn-helix domain-containing protein, partial [Hyphomicrobiales bacterium]|nr:helix-turn-helix domain-containing protein [Hyphomicrobiales bacterium]
MATRAAATRRAKGGAAAPGAREASSPVARALSLLETVAGFASPPRFSEIEGAAGLPKATLHRMLRLLEGEGALRFDAHARRYSLGLRLIRLARSSWDSASLAEVARPHLDALFARHGVTLHLACLDSGHVLYLDKRAARVSPTIFSAVGRIGPAYCTGVGKAMLAALPAAELEAAIARQSFEAHTPNTIR